MKIVDINKTSHPDFVPKCPWCREHIEEVYRVPDHKGMLHHHLGFLYACPHCGAKLDFEYEFD
ncbi:MAG: hypothetical protein R3F34_17355 [Planctomycetota bacterium]